MFCVKELLDCFKEATVQLSAENSATISLVMALIQGIEICPDETPVLTTIGKEFFTIQEGHPLHRAIEV